MAQDEALTVVRLVNEARRKSDGTPEGMTAWLEKHKEFMATDTDAARHDSAIGFIELEKETALHPPVVVKALQLKAGMALEVDPKFNVRLDLDSYIDETGKLRIEGVRLDTGEDFKAYIDPKLLYFVSREDSIAEALSQDDGGIGL